MTVSISGSRRSRRVDLTTPFDMAYTVSQHSSVDTDVPSFTVTELPLPHIPEIVQKIGKARFISSCDMVSGYHQCLVAPEDRWKTALVCDNSQFEWTRCPFGLKSSGCTFVRALQEVLNPLKRCVESYVDDVAVHTGDVTCTDSSEESDWKQHLKDLESFFGEFVNVVLP